VIIFAGLAVAVVVVWALGGRFANLGSVKVRGKAIIIVALALQFLVITIAPLAFSHSIDTTVHLASYGLAIAFLFANRQLPNLWIAALGGACNLAAIVANGGEMPVVHEGFVNSAPVAHARFAFLGDIFSVPKSLPFANVFSIGDVLLLIGATAMLAGICGCPRISALDRILSGRSRGMLETVGDPRG
jgi:Family of unknown function (DUF5317)